MRTTDWKFDFSTLPHWDNREKVPYVYDEFYEIPEKDMLVCIYSVAEVSMLNYQGFLAILRNKEKPELFFNIADFSFYVDFYQAEGGEILILQPAVHLLEKREVLRPVLALDMPNNRFCYMKYGKRPITCKQITKPWRKWYSMDKLSRFWDLVEGKKV